MLLVRCRRHEPRTPDVHALFQEKLGQRHQFLPKAPELFVELQHPGMAAPVPTAASLALQDTENPSATLSTLGCHVGTGEGHEHQAGQHICIAIFFVQAP